MTGIADLLDEVDRIEALAELTAADLDRLDAIADDADSFVALMAKMARNAIGLRTRAADRRAALKSQGSTEQGELAAAAVKSDPGLGVPYTDAEAEQGTPPGAPLHLAAGEGSDGEPIGSDPVLSTLSSTPDHSITRQATDVANHVTGLDTMAGGKFVSYLRVSTDRQGRSGLGLEAQRKAVTDFLAGGRWALVREFVEVESGKRADRPQLAEAMALCRVHGATLVIAKLDRLSRDAHFLLGLEKAGVDFIAADMPTANRLTVGIMAMVADEERRMISARTKAALAVAKARGTKLGGDRGNFALIAARGRAAGVAARRARANARTADLAPIITGLQALGVTSLAGLAAALTERGIPTSRGAERWSAMQVSRVLKAAANGA